MTDREGGCRQRDSIPQVVEENATDPLVMDQRAHITPDVPWNQRSWQYELRPFRGMWSDVRRRIPFYKSDWLDACRRANWLTVSTSVVRIFFINLMPALAYVLDMYERTEHSYGVNEVLLASALAAIVFSVFSVQPLTFVGVTGLTDLMNYTIYRIFHGHYGFDQTDYLRIQAWVLIWAAGFHFLVAIFNLCDFTRFITEMTSDTFGLYVGVIYVEKGIEQLIQEFSLPNHANDTGWLSVSIAILFCITVYYLTQLGASTYLPFQIRRTIGSLAFVAGCVFWSGFSHFPKHSIKEVPISYLPITRSFFPTWDRGWVVDFWNIEVRWVFVAAPLGLMIMLLFYFDHNVSSVMAQARKFPITKPAGFHWDFFLLGITTFVSGILGLPVPNGLVPQAPDHTDSLSVYKQVPAAEESDKDGAGTPAVEPLHHTSVASSFLHISHFPRVHTVRVVEQRLSHLVIGLLTLGSMSRPILVALSMIPRAVLAGVFLLVGFASIESNPIVTRTLSLLQDRSALTPSTRSPLKRTTLARFVSFQWLFFGMTIAISQTIAAIGFPIIITCMIPCRAFLVPKMFAAEELAALDAPTADAPAVMVSLGPKDEDDLQQPVHYTVS